MACEKPLRGYPRADGTGISLFKSSDPQYYQEPYEGFSVPCGTCILCRGEHARQWAVRITHEAQLHKHSSFITLTYDDDHLPEHNSLQYSDLRDFLRRLRRRLGKLRYYAVGEYGDKTLRPHYHACIFGNAFTHNRLVLKTEPYLLWTCPDLDEAWGKGHASVGALTFQTAQYTASYVTKKLNSKKQYVRTDVATGELIPLTQPRAFMSLKPGIGKEWLEKYGKYTYSHDHVVIDGRPQKPPKYYDRWLKQQSETNYEKIKQRRLSKVVKQTPEQLRARATNARARKTLKTL